MTLQEAINHIPAGSGHDLAIKVSGLVGAGTSFAGATSDLTHLTVLSQIAANFGILLGAVVAAFSLGYSVYKGIKKPNDKSSS
tara:strand:- start:10597 stop:10845 length:249 start_codon:yes stop_codon:yes gene_type:complete